MPTEVFSPKETYPILEIKDPDCLHEAVAHFIKKSLESATTTNPDPRTSFIGRFRHLHFYPFLFENNFARYQPATDIGRTSFPAGSFNKDSIPTPLKERLLFALGDSLDSLQVEVERYHQETGGKSSRITIAGTTGNRNDSDNVTAKADAQTLQFSTKVNGQVVYLDQNNLERRLILSTGLAKFAYERLCVYLRSVGAR